MHHGNSQWQLYFLVRPQTEPLFETGIGGEFIRDGIQVPGAKVGGIDGEFCPQDRALIFEDPNGTRILYDPGRTVAGAADPRLGKIDIILVSHMHGDHLGNAHNKAPNSGSCAAPDMSVSAMPNSLAVNIALAKKSKIVTGSEMPPFFAAKLKAKFAS